jgi:hypothetical protein
MSPDEQAERDQIAMTLDILLGITSIELRRSTTTAAERASERLAQERRGIDPSWAEHWRRNAVA